MLWRMALKVTLALICAIPAVVDAGPGKRGELAKSRFTQVVYPVADLVVPLDGIETGEKPGSTLEDRLMDLIKATVAPASWKESGVSCSLCLRTRCPASRNTRVPRARVTSGCFKRPRSGSWTRTVAGYSHSTPFVPCST